MSTVSPLTMLTFGPMIDSELCRFILWRYGLPFREHRHIFGWASILALLRGGTGQIPLIYGRGVKFIGPRAMIDHYEGLCDQNRTLIPAQQPLRTHVEADWVSFNGELASYSAKIAYFYLLPHRDILLEPFTQGVPPIESRVTPGLYPALRGLFTILLQLSPAVVADCVAHAQRIFGDVDRRIADGRNFLHGDKPNLADLSIATAAAPLLLPEGYSAPSPTYEHLPADLKLLVDSFRERSSAALVRRVYALRAMSLPPATPT